MEALMVAVAVLALVAIAGILVARARAPRCPKCSARGAESMGWDKDGSQVMGCGMCGAKWTVPSKSQDEKDTEDRDRGYG